MIRVDTAPRPERGTTRDPRPRLGPSQAASTAGTAASCGGAQSYRSNRDESRSPRDTAHESANPTRLASLGLMLVTEELRLDPYATALIQSITREAHRADRNLVLLLSRLSGRRGLIDQFAAAAIEGAIVLAPSLGDDLAHQILDVDDRPVVFVGRTRPEDTQVTSVDVENYKSCAALVGHLLDTAGPRVAMIAGAEGRLSSELRLGGYRLAHAQRRLKVDESLIRHGDFTRVSGYQNARQLLALKPDALFAANDEMGLGAALAASELGLEIPRDLSLAGFDGSSSLRIDEARLTSADQPFDAIAKTAVRELIAATSGDYEPVIRLLEPRLHFGWSTNLPL